VVEHLKSANRLTDKLAADILLRYVPIGEKRAYREVWEAFLRNPGMPIVSERTVREAVKEGVRAELFGLRVDEEIYFGRDVPDSVLEEAELIPKELALELTAPKEAAPPRQEKMKPEAPKVLEPIKPRAKTSYKLHAKVPFERLSDFLRGVILPLRESADKLDVEIVVRAKKEAGLPQDVLERKVRETLRQLQAEILEEREE